MPEKVLKAVVGQLDDPKKHVRFVIATAAREQTVLPHEILKAVVARLEDPNKSLLGTAYIFVLGRQSVLCTK